MAINIELVEQFDYPATTVFAFLTNIKRYPEWIEEVQAITRMPQTPLGIGSTYAQSAKYFGRDVVIEMEIIDYQPNRLLKLKSSGTMPTITTWQLAAEGKVTRVQFNFEGEPGDLYDMIAPGLAGSIERGFEAQLQNLKALISKENS